MLRFLGVTAAGLCVCIAPSAQAACASVNPSAIQSAYPSLGIASSVSLANALSNISALENAANASVQQRSLRQQRVAELRDQIQRYEAQRNANRRPINLRSRNILGELLRQSPPDPAHITRARAELRDVERQTGTTAVGEDRWAAADTQLGQAIDTLNADVSQTRTYEMLLDSDRLVRQRLLDCASLQGNSGRTLTASMGALDRFDRAIRPALGSAAAVAAPRFRSEIAALGSSESLRAWRQKTMPTAAAQAAMDANGVQAAYSSKLAELTSAETSAAQVRAAQAKRQADERQRLADAQRTREDAAQRRLLDQQRAQQGPASGGGSRGGGSSGEPTEAQMRAAIQANSGRVAERMGMGSITRITYFEKVGCEKAQGRVGWMCDYLVRMDGNPVTAFSDALAGPGTAFSGNGRFVLRANGWDVFNDPR